MGCLSYPGWHIQRTFTKATTLITTSLFKSIRIGATKFQSIKYHLRKIDKTLK